MKKFLAMLMAAAMMLSLAACGSGSTDSSSSSSDDSSSSSSSDGQITLKIACWDQSFNIPPMKAAAEAYMADHPNVTIEIVETQSDDNETAIITAGSSKDYSTLPDIFLMQDNSYQKFLYNYPEVFADLTDTGINWDDFAAFKVNYSTVDGAHYAVPFDNGAVGTFMREDILEQYGYSIEDFEGVTWERVIEIGKDIKAQGGPALLSGQSGAPDTVLIMLQSCGASMFDEEGNPNMTAEENPALAEAVGYYAEMVEEGIYVETADWDGYCATLTSDDPLTNNGVIGTINGNWIIGTIKLNTNNQGKWVMASTGTPAMTSGTPSNYSNNGGSSWAVNAQGDNVDVAIDFLTSTFGQVGDSYTSVWDDALSTGGVVATYLPAGESDLYAQDDSYFGEPIWATLAAFAGETPSNNTGAYYYDARTALGTAIQQVIEGTDISTALAEAQSTVEFNMGG
jgi:lactose/L-arabinose transport system substrate-binding protein